MLRFFYLLFIGSAAFAQIDRGVLAKYSFNDGLARNEAGSIQPVVQGASFVEDRFGNPKSAIYLHGNPGSYINLGTDSIIKPRHGSISMWVNVELIMYKGNGWDYNPILLTKSHNGDDFYEGYFIGLNFNTNKLNVTTSKDQDNQVSLNSTHALTLRQWHHIVMMYDDDYLTLYLDNELEARMPKNFRSIFLANDSVMIGNSANQKNQRYLCGSVDDIQVFNRVLSREEVDALYNASNPNLFQLYFNWGLKIAAGLLTLVLIYWLTRRYYRREIQKEQKKNELQARMNDLETKAIRIQMNPHFMFNSLNTLQRFILEQDFENAHLYLTRFSKMLRKLLESSTSEAIALSEEISILGNYIELEKLRFENAFVYAIHCNIAQPENVFLPFMLIQPFVENAIWHGLLPKKSGGCLTITFDEHDEKRIVCTIDDNGAGRNRSKQVLDPLKTKSLSLEFIRQRLELIEKSKGVSCSFRIVDKTNAQQESLGTTVEILLPKMQRP